MNWGKTDIMTDESARKPNHGGIVAALLLLPVLYVLSIGPVARMGIKYGVWNSTQQRIYFPVLWLHDHTILKKPLED